MHASLPLLTLTEASGEVLEIKVGAGLTPICFTFETLVALAGRAIHNAAMFLDVISEVFARVSSG
jgi:hypothetical protein